MAGRLTKTGEASIVDLFEPYVEYRDQLTHIIELV